MSHGPSDGPIEERPRGQPDGGPEEPRDDVGDQPRAVRPDEAGATPRRVRGGSIRARGAGARETEDDGPSVATYAGLGFQFLAAILLFLYVGRWLDARLGTRPWLLVVGVLVGAGAGFYSLYKKLMTEQAREDARRAARNAGRPPP